MYLFHSLRIFHLVVKILSAFKTTWSFTSTVYHGLFKPMLTSEEDLILESSSAQTGRCSLGSPCLSEVYEDCMRSSFWVLIKQHERKTRCTIFDKHSLSHRCGCFQIPSFLPDREGDPGTWLCSGKVLSFSWKKWQEEHIPNGFPFIFLYCDKGWPNLDVS